MTKIQTVWITGAASGIGKALAIGYSKQKHNVVVSDRAIEALEAVAEKCRSFGVKAYVAPFDLTDISSLPSVVKKVQKEVRSIDILINNGGISQRSTIAETPLTVDRKIFETNFFGTIEFTKAVLPWMVETGGGAVAVVSSIAGLFGFPLRSSYSASKHALSGYFETLGLEYIGDKIFTTIIYPGRIQTDLSLRAITASGESHNKMDKGQRTGMPVDLCANKIIRAISRRKRSILIGRKELILAYVHRYFPSLFWKIAPKIDPN